jgi:hypothetical protein
MIRKLLVAMLIAGAALFSTACWEEALGYTCSGLGTCDDPKYCCDIDYYTADCWWIADGRTFDCDYSYGDDCTTAYNDLTDYCYYAY